MVLGGFSLNGETFRALSLHCRSERPLWRNLGEKMKSKLILKFSARWHGFPVPKLRWRALGVDCRTWPEIRGNLFSDPHRELLFLGLTELSRTERVRRFRRHSASEVDGTEIALLRWKRMMMAKIKRSPRIVRTSTLLPVEATLFSWDCVRSSRNSSSTHSRSTR